MTKKLKLKICGMRDTDNILEVSALQPDYMGFIFYAKSKRFVGNDFVIPAGLSKSIKRVGVFVNETTEQIIELMKLHQLDLAQLHGEESVGQCADLKAAGFGVIKVFSIGEQFDFAGVKPYKKDVDYFLFDTKSENYGGTGRSFNWNLLENYDQEVPFFLSGGLSISNIKSVSQLKATNLHAIDINSGVEVKPGLKDVEKMNELKHILHSNF